MSRYHRTSAAIVRAKKARARVTLPTQCARCGGVIEVGEAYDMGHAVDVSAGGQDSPLYPEHRRCNRRAGGMLGAKVTHSRRQQRPDERPNW